MDGREYGPVSQEQLQTWIREGRVDASTLVCLEGALDWRALRALPEFRSLMAPAPFAGAPVQPGHRQINRWAVWGFICGLLSLTLCSCCCLPLDLLGIVFSVIGLVQISNSPQTQSGTALAILGLALSILSLVLGFALSALWMSTGAGEELMRELERNLSAGAGWVLQSLARMPILD